MWSLGCMLYALLFGHPPFEASKDGMETIAKGELRLSFSKRISRPAQDLIEQLIHKVHLCIYL